MTRRSSATRRVKSATLAAGALHEGNPVWVVGLSADGQPHTRNTQIANVDPLALPLSRSMRFRDTNIDVAQLVNPPGDYDGVLSNEAGEVIGLWSSYAIDNGRDLSQENRGVRSMVLRPCSITSMPALRCTVWKPSSFRCNWPMRASWG